MLWRTLLVIASLVLVSACQAQAPAAEPFVSGTHYFPIEPAVATSAPAGKVEVVEVFSYACIHCAHFEPQVAAWRAKMPKEASFSYLPAAWNPQWEGFAKAFYAAEALGVLERTHEPMFKALHEERRQFNSLDDLAQWYAGHGTKADAFLSAFNAMTTTAAVERAKKLVPEYGVDGTPSVIVAGKYRITGASAGGMEKVFDVVNHLVAKESSAGGKR
jgi:protein dithiol oxidoreductase (disulfide-forming)